MAAAAILDLFEPKIAPLDPPSRQRGPCPPPAKFIVAPTNFDGVISHTAYKRQFGRCIVRDN